MSARTLGTITGEGFSCTILEYSDGLVEFLADADIDADGANGQNGARAAYTVDDRGTEALANGGMKVNPNAKERAKIPVVWKEAWGRDIALASPEGDFPLIIKGGIIPTKTAYRFPKLGGQNPAAYVDSETVPFIVVPPLIVQKTKGVVMGCMARVTDVRTGRAVNGVVADLGPRKKVGEVSIAMARSLQIPHSPRDGGVSRPVLRYQLWPGIPAVIAGFTFRLQRANGTHV